MTTTVIATLLNWIQIAYGFYWLYSGLNGFFHWQKIPVVAKEITTISELFVASSFLMTTVKAVEVVVGLCYITGFGSFIGVLLLTPLIWGICGLHLRYNPKPLKILAFIIPPYLALIWKHSDYWSRLL